MFLADERAYDREMNAPFTRRPLLRWAAPGVALATIIAGSQVAAHWPAHADTDLPPRTAAQLLTDVQQAGPVAMSGTVTATMALGLPELPTSGSNPTAPLNLLSGTHTAKVWYDGGTQSRIAVLGKSAETDVVTNDSGLWVWQSADRSVLHVAPTAGDQGPKAYADRTGPSHSGIPSGKSAVPGGLSTPEGVATWALKMLEPTTSVTTTSNERVAGCAAYELVLTPKTSNTKVGSIHVAIDAKHHIPLRAEVFARGADKPAINVGFSSIDFGKQPASRFDFTPPPGAKVTTPKKSAKSRNHAKSPRVTSPRAKADLPQVVGKGWSSVLVGTIPTKTTGKKANQDLQRALKVLPKVSGSWGQGHLLDTALLSAVITDDGHFAVGAVQPKTLYAALG